MQNFRTELKPDKAAHAITLASGVLTTGSCFADTIGKKLAENKFTSCINPFGTSYNPYSIHKLLRLALHQAYPAEQAYDSNNDLYFHYDFHSAFSSPEKSILDSNIRQAIHHTHNFLKTANRVIVTYGTSVVYKRKDTGEIVANCHKADAGSFTKSILSEKKILESFEGFYQDLKAFNSACKIILTVSPVRHLKDTLPLNSVSKSVLRVACHTITETHPDVLYFPAYEIMLDDLRDYRFYKSDMLHPSPDAEEYIWNKFSEAMFDDDTRDFLTRWKSIQASLHHKPFHAQSASHQKFLKQLLTELQELNNRVNVEEEIAYVKAQFNHAS